MTRPSWLGLATDVNVPKTPPIVFEREITIFARAGSLTDASR